jgi:MFS family permease
MPKYGTAQYALVSDEPKEFTVRRYSTVLRNHPEFFKLWIGQSISNFGSAITTLALPLIAVVLLKATPLQMGVLGALAFLPHLLFGLPAGVWVDRWPRRPIMILADFGQALLLGSIPALALLGALRIEILYLVAFLKGILALLADVAATSYVPSLIGRTDLMQANSVSALSQSTASMVGPVLAGSLLQLFSAPLVIALDSVSFLLSAFCARLIQSDEPVAVQDRGKRRFRIEMAEGLRFVMADPTLRALIGPASVGALAGAIQQTVLILFLVREIGLTPSWLGVIFSTNGIAAILGALLVGRLTERLGSGSALMVGQLIWAIAALLLPFVGGPLLVAVPVLLTSQALSGIGALVVRVNQLTVRQALVPNRFLGRMNAIRRFLVFGVIPLGSLLGGLFGQTVGLRGALLIGGLGMALAFVWLARSPVRMLYESESLRMQISKHG